MGWIPRSTRVIRRKLARKSLQQQRAVETAAGYPELTDSSATQKRGTPADQAPSTVAWTGQPSSLAHGSQIAFTGRSWDMDGAARAAQVNSPARASRNRLGPLHFCRSRRPASSTHGTEHGRSIRQHQPTAHDHGSRLGHVQTRIEQPARTASGNSPARASRSRLGRAILVWQNTPADQAASTAARTEHPSTPSPLPAGRDHGRGGEHSPTRV
jgi:hypothetical protein